MLEIWNKKRNVVYIWGCGHNAEMFIKRFHIYIESIIDNRYKEWWYDCVGGFIDSNESRRGGDFYGKSIVSLDYAIDSGMNCCIITVYDRTSIIEDLHNKGFDDEKIFYWKDFLDTCKRDLLNESSYIFNSISEKDLLCRYLVFSGEIEKSLDNNNKKSRSLIRYIDDIRPSEWIGSLAWYFGDEVDRAEVFLSGIKGNIKRQNLISREKTSIGMLVDRFYGGGIEKVVSLLLDRFSDKDYASILITEERNNKKDYTLSEKVTRCLLTEPHDGVIEERLKQLENFVDDNDVKIMIFHSGYARVSTFYELLLMKVLGIPTILVLHSAHSAVMADQPGVSDLFPYIYRMADEMVAVSERDKEYLESVGCSCSYIPNPIETFGIGNRTKQIYKDRFKVLWIGRIVQRAKQVLDTVDIMNIVAKRMDNVDLTIIGGKDDEKIYRGLIEKIRYFGLDDRIELLEYRPNIKEVYREANIVLITSSTESFSNVLAEAKVFSRPVVMYEIPWLALAKDKRGVITVKQNDVTAAADAIVNLLSNQQILERYSEDAWLSIQPYIGSDIIEDWIEIIRKLKQL